MLHVGAVQGYYGLNITFAQGLLCLHIVIVFANMINGDIFLRTGVGYCNLIFHNFSFTLSFTRILPLVRGIFYKSGSCVIDTGAGGATNISACL